MSFWLNQNNKNPKAIPALHCKRKNKLYQRNVCMKSIKTAYLNSIHTLRAKKAFCCHSLQGSMTVEAGLVVPLLFFAWIAFISLISAVRIHEKVQHTLAEAGLKIAIEAGWNEKSVRDSWFLKVMSDMQSLGDGRTGGIQSVSDFDLSGSDVMGGSEWIYLEVKYRIKLLEGLIPLPMLNMKSSVKVRAWTGYIPGELPEAGADNAHYAYCTEYGQVYHEDRLCSHIKLKIYRVGAIQAENYPPCEKCAGKSSEKGGTFYLTETGDCYHNRLGCSGLKRNVERIEIEEAIKAGLVPCMRCAGE